MLRVLAPLNLVTLVISVLVTAFDIPPLQSDRYWGLGDGSPPVTLDSNDQAEWSLKELPNTNITDHLVFETVHSLLQHWPNTRMRSGHNIVPGVVPKGTLLYHGRDRKEFPSSPDWVALDPEYAHMCCWDVFSILPELKDECWYLTLVTTRPLKVVYFDGSSAALFPDGSLDAQDLIIWGESRPGDVLHERRRIKDLCEWVTEFNVDGIIRMIGDFELMLCDFTSGVSEVSFLNLNPPDLQPPNPAGLAVFEAINAGSRHDRFPGETRIQLDLTRLVSFYDTELVPSLVAARASQERWDHRLRNISSDDLSTVKTRVETVLTGSWGSPTGIDWKTHIQVIVDQFSRRFELMRHLLNSPATDLDETIDFANKTQTQLRTMLTPYITLLDAPTDSSNKTDHDWTIPVYKRCATMHTYPIESELGIMTDSEKLLFQAVRGTSREICRVLTKMWVSGVYAGIDSLLNTKASLDVAEVAELRSEWVAELNWLMTWLDWSIWVKCVPDCGPRELCYLPTWPIGFPGFPFELTGPLSRHGGRQERLTSFLVSQTRGAESSPEMPSSLKPGADEWIRPQPKCISLVDSYEV